MSLLKKNKGAFSIALLAIIAIGLWTSYQYVFAAPAKTNEITATYTGAADEFKYLVTENPASWSQKIVQLKGTVTAINEEGILLNGTIYCQFENKQNLQSISKNQSVVIKGKYVGFDELLMEIKINQCIIIQ